ncbi:MAG: class I SAM-dependent methyltransferase [Clostridia bacterium]|nr:class I SAM-dependent methyltransferase [Clostridia bacterium]
MEHYYSNNPTSKSEERIIEYKIKEKNIKFISDNGVFSKGHVDIATNFMLNVLIEENILGKLLDVGCGYGTIGITLSKFFDIDVTMLDINERALNLARKNVKLNNVENIKIIESDGLEKINEEYDVIVTNPPIRAGKAVIYKMYEDSYKHLKNGGVLYLVINKKHGAPSTKDFLTQLFGNCEILDKKTGFNVMKCVKENT